MVTKSLAWLWARTWGRWALVFVTIALLSQINRWFDLGWDRWIWAGWTAVGIVLLFWSSFFYIPAGRMGIFVSSFPFADDARFGTLAVGFEKGIRARPEKPTWGVHILGKFYGTMRIFKTPEVPGNKVGKLVALAGSSRPTGVAVTPWIHDIEDLKDGEAALLDGMHEGVQRTLLGTGEHIINALSPGEKKPDFPHDFLYQIVLEDYLRVSTREEAVLFVNVGGMPRDEDVLYWGNGPGEYSGAILKAQQLDQAGCRGIFRTPLSPGSHPVNQDHQDAGGFPGEVRAILVDTTTNTLFLDDPPSSHEGDRRGHHHFQPLLLKSKNNFRFLVKIKLAFKVQDTVKVTATDGTEVKISGAVLVIARGGTLQDFVRDILVPLVSSVAIGTIGDMKIEDFFDKMKEVQRELLQKIKDALASGIAGGKTYPEIEAQTIMLTMDSKGFPETEEYIRTHTTRHMQPAVVKMKEAEQLAAQADIPLQKAKAEARYAEIAVQARLRKDAAGDLKEATATELQPLVAAGKEMAQAGVSWLAQAVISAAPLIRERTIEHGERLRDIGDIGRERIRTDQRKADTQAGNVGRKHKKRLDRQGSPTKENPPEQDDDEGEDTGEEE